ncbi:hypothetical protein [Marinobacter gelidimuriae]|uniref:hypothetical protein n=1 Tax=Marinobacter gelidimuriae TaxID=2739064 RepID=UPI00037997F9|nr:hypothetical protein [Marinobacter gelidimuriae]
MSNNPVTVTDIFALEAEPPIDFTAPAFDLELPLIDFELPDIDLELPAPTEGVKR